MYTANFHGLTRLLKGREVRASEATSGGQTRTLDFASAIELAELTFVNNRLDEISQDGVIDWSGFDILDFARLMPSIAILNQVQRDDGSRDFRYGFVGENINAIARMNLRGAFLGDVLTGVSRDQIIDEYMAAITERTPRASGGNVTISDMYWLSYLRFLYPAQTENGVDRVLLIMLFSTGE